MSERAMWRACAGAVVLMGGLLGGCSDDDDADTPAGSTTAASSSGQGGGEGGAGTGGDGGSAGGTGGEGGGTGGAGGGATATATAQIVSRSMSTVTGTAVFSLVGDEVTVVIDVEGATPGDHAVHIHDMPSCEMDGMAAMGHWNPDMSMHGMWGSADFHLGDIGNMTVDANGVGQKTLTTDLWTLGTGAMNDVVGHAIMVHADADDFVTQPTGNAGARVGCGVIAEDM